jgi:hypothetical protein
MAKMAITTCAEQFLADHEVGPVLTNEHRPRRNLFEKAGPSASGMELVLGRVELRTAAGTMEKAFTWIFQVAACAGALGCRPAQDCEFGRVKKGLPIFGCQRMGVQFGVKCGVQWVVWAEVT